MPVRLIAMDIDGTLVDTQSRVPAENSRVICEAAARGIEILLVTGRRFDFARSISDQLPCDFFMITSNGAVIKSKAGESHLLHTLDRHIAHEVLMATKEFRMGAALMYDRPGQRQVIVERLDFEHPSRGQYLKRNRQFVSGVEPLTDALVGEGSCDPIEVCFTGTCAEVRAVKNILESLPIASQYTLASTEYAFRDFAFLDVLRRGVTKGAALAEWSASRGIAREEVMAIGDNFNDREMLEFAGVPVVMGNAIPELKSLGWPVTLSNDENGVAEAIRIYAFGETAESVTK